MHEELLNDFDVSGLDQDNTVVRCETQEEANIFLEYLHSKGIYREKDIKGLMKEWKRHEDETCYHLSRQSWCYASWYKEYRPMWRIVYFCDIYKGYAQQEPQNYTISFDEIL